LYSQILEVFDAKRLTHIFSLLFLAPITVNQAISTALPVKVKVEVGDGEPIESALRRFKREINKSGHLMELRHKRYFENPQERKIRKVKESRMRKKFERMNKRRMANRT
jgi:small subunit ribosomal protein S21